MNISSKTFLKIKGIDTIMSEEEGTIRVRLPEEGEVLGQVIQMLGNRILSVRCTDGYTRKVRISGKHRRRMWVNLGDVITLLPDYGMDEEQWGTMTHRYKAKGSKLLYQRKLIPEEYLL
tara:strand:+ start:1922 stop:2278 length:357 start_codon:yes stop_codon:yes gene_type:complete